MLISSFKIFAHETPAFVRKQPDYGAAGSNHAETNQSYLMGKVGILPVITGRALSGILNNAGYAHYCWLLA
jgi:hypothetical protein